MTTVVAKLIRPLISLQLAILCKNVKCKKIDSIHEPTGVAIFLKIIATYVFVFNYKVVQILKHHRPQVESTPKREISITT